MIDRPKPARLELLIRESGGQPFTTRTVESAPVFRGYKPARIVDSQWELAEQPAGIDGRARYVLRNRATHRYLLLGEPERVAWDLMDGSHTIMEIAGALFFRFGAFDMGPLQRFLAQLRSADLLVLPRWNRLRAAVERLEGRWWARLLRALFRGVDRCTVPIRDVDDWLGRVYAAGAWMLATRAAVVAALALAVGGAAALLSTLPEAGAMAARLWARPVLSSVLLALTILPGIALHELGHALACKGYGRRVREFGFTLLHGLVPIFYADVTDIFMASRRARIVVSLAGPMANLVIGSVAFLVALLTGGYVRAFLVAIGVLQWESVALNLYPFTFVALDGYHVLVDWLGLPTLKESARWFVRTELVPRLKGRTGLRRHEWVFVGYMALSAAFVAAFTGAHARAVLAWFGG